MMRKRSSGKSLTPTNSVTMRIYQLLCLCGLFIVATPLLLSVKRAPCANSNSCTSDLSGSYKAASEGEFLGQKIAVPTVSLLAQSSFQPSVLGETTSVSGKHIYVNLTKQELTAYEGDKIALRFPISSGKWYPTPTGDFRIWVKLRYTRMSGGDPAIHTYYDLPNVPFTMFFYNENVGKTRGFALHGAYWHNNFGHPMSHGCINISNENAEHLYNWADPFPTSTMTYATYDDPGTAVTIYGETPNE